MCELTIPFYFLYRWLYNGSLLLINKKKTKEIIFGLSEYRYQKQGSVHNTVSSNKDLGVCVDAALSWSAHIDYLCCKVQQHICFIRSLRSFGANKQILLLFFSICNTECCAKWNMCLHGIVLSLFITKLDSLDCYLFDLKLQAKSLSKVFILKICIQKKKKKKPWSCQEKMSVTLLIFCMRNIIFCL